MLRALLLVLAVVTTNLASAAESAVILMYHHFGDDRFPTTNVTLEQFTNHLAYLAEHDFTVLPLNEVLYRLYKREPLPERTVAITMDDAYRSVYTEAFPRLNQRGWPFTVFVSTDYVDNGYANYMSWDQMREMAAAGVAFANHSASHRHLVLPVTEGSWAASVGADLSKAQERLQAELGLTANSDPPLLAYPYGEYSDALANLVRELGYIAFGQHSGAVGYESDMRALPRFPMAADYAEMKSFVEKVWTLPLPVIASTPWDPLTESRQPRLELAINTARVNPESVACFVSGQGATPLTWLDKMAGRFALAAEQPLATGRQRYNCTAPTGEARRYYWFSHPWIVLPKGETLTD